MHTRLAFALASSAAILSFAALEACGPSDVTADGGAHDGATDASAHADAPTGADATGGDAPMPSDVTPADGGDSDGSASGDASTGGSGDGTGDTFLPWEGGSAYYRTFAHGPPSDPSFFPLTVWLQSPRNAARYAAIGINMFVGQYNDPTAADLGTMAAAHVSVACDQDATTLPLASNADLVMWTQQDEPDNAQSDGHGGYDPCVTPAALMDLYTQFHAHDATRPVFLSFGRGVAFTTWVGRGTCTGDLGYYMTAVGAGDVISYDIYPANATETEVAGKLYLVADGVDRLRADVHDAKPVWPWIETTRISSSDGPGPTPAQTRAEVWMSIVHGAMGIGYFAHTITPFDETGLLDDDAMSAAVGAINAQVTSLAPVLNTPPLANGATVTSSNSAVPVDILVKRQGGALYIFAASMRPGTTTATFSIRGAPATGSVEVLGESRTLSVAGGAFQDDFGTYSVHLYRVTY
jgi:hypothetical protein